MALASRFGVLGAIGFAAWLGIPVFAGVAVEQVSSAGFARIEAVVVFLLVAFALFTAWRFTARRGWIAGPVLLVALIVEVAKRLAIQGHSGFGAADTIIAILIFIGLVIGVRAAQAMRDAGT